MFRPLDADTFISFLFTQPIHSFSRICPSMLLVMVNGPRHKMAMAINMIRLSSLLVGKFASPILIVFHPPIPFISSYPSYFTYQLLLLLPINNITLIYHQRC